jgi:hypothetical protein
MFRHFRFLEALHLPLIRLSRPDLVNKLNLDNKLESTKEYASDLALSLLETACKALGEEIHSLERVMLGIQLLEYHFDLTANLRRRTSGEGSWVEVHVYHTYD